MRDGKGINVPPKELHVLRLLLGSAGTVISKDHLLDKVWPEIDAAEESLTRCIYVLRKLLKDDKDFIVTVYGQGYRFACPVVLLDLTSPAPATVPSLAVLPFRGLCEAQGLDLQDAMIRQMTTAFGEALRVVPAGLMAAYGQPVDAQHLVERLMPDFYLSGRCIGPAEQQHWSVELIRGCDHVLLHGQILSGDGLREALGDLTCLVAQRLPGLRSAGQTCSSYSAAVAFLKGLCSLQQHTPQSLRNALVQFQHCLQLDDRYAPSWCGFADAWLGKALLGLCEQGRAIDEAHAAVSKALLLDSGSTQALVRLALLTSLRGCEDAARVIFQRCLSTADQADVHYFYAWHHWYWRRNDQAEHSIDKCLRHDSNGVKAHILRVRIALTGDPQEAMLMARRTLQQGVPGHSLLMILHALVLAFFGQPAAAWHQLEQAGLSESALGEQGLAAWNVLFGVNPLTARNQYVRWLQLAKPRPVHSVALSSGPDWARMVAPLWRSFPRATDTAHSVRPCDNGRHLA